MDSKPILDKQERDIVSLSLPITFEKERVFMKLYINPKTLSPSTLMGIALLTYIHDETPLDVLVSDTCPKDALGVGFEKPKHRNKSRFVHQVTNKVTECVPGEEELGVPYLTVGSIVEENFSKISKDSIVLDLFEKFLVLPFDLHEVGQRPKNRSKLGQVELQTLPELVERFVPVLGFDKDKESVLNTGTGVCYDLIQGVISKAILTSKQIKEGKVEDRVVYLDTLPTPPTKEYYQRKGTHSIVYPEFGEYRVECLGEESYDLFPKHVRGEERFSEDGRSAWATSKENIKNVLNILFRRENHA